MGYSHSRNYQTVLKEQPGGRHNMMIQNCFTKWYRTIYIVGYNLSLNEGEEKIYTYSYLEMLKISLGDTRREYYKLFYFEH